jgi:hypothetical protein
VRARGGNARQDEVLRSRAHEWTLWDSCSLDVPSQALAPLDRSVTRHDCSFPDDRLVRSISREVQRRPERW